MIADLSTFVAVHDQQSLDTAVENLSHLSNVRYVFLGPRPCPDREDVIHCSDYGPDMRNLYDFVGFIVLSQENLITTPFVNFLQYDHEVVSGDFTEDIIVNQLKDDLGMITFVPAGYDPNNWMLQVSNFESVFREALICCGVYDDYSKLDISWWPTTQGHAWRSSYFYAFMQWVAPALSVIADYQYAGHIAERLLTVYTLLTHRAQAIGGLFFHGSADCHGTGALMRGNIDEFHAKDAVFGR